VNDAEAGSIGKLLAEISAEMAEMRKAHASDIACAVAEERAAVVAWLRHCDKLCRDLDGRETPVRGLYRLSADRIERGEHRREEK
jgi:hypothetical protein